MHDEFSMVFDEIKDILLRATSNDNARRRRASLSPVARRWGRLGPERD